MPDDLHTTLTAAVQARLDVARAATPGPWRVCAEGSEGSRIAPASGTMREQSRFIGIMNGRVQPEDGRNARHIALNDPAFVIRSGGRDVAVLKRHEPVYQIPLTEGGQRWVCRSRCKPVPCVELAELATVYGVEDQ